MTHAYFSPDFASARGRFRTLTGSARGKLACIPLETTDPGGKPLAIDIAWLGASQPRRALIHVSGIHGVEGFAGAAIQAAALQSPVDLPHDTALILVHVFNPYGMSWLRRCNGSNVDLNRNFFFGDHDWQSEASGYAALDAFLNPQRPPSTDMFHLRLLLAQIGLGTRAIRQAVASGQHINDKGLFFAGGKLEDEPRLYLDWLNKNLCDVEHLCVVDVHTGLGPFGQSSLFIRSDLAKREELAARLGLPIISPENETNVMGYEFDGGHCKVYRSALPHARIDFLTQEFGTWSGRRLLRVLRAENQHHHYGSGALDHWSKKSIKEAFCPASPAWRKNVIESGLLLLTRALETLTSPGNDKPESTR